MNEWESQRVYDYLKNPKDSKTLSDKAFVNLDDGRTHWTCFIVKENKSYFYDSFEGSPYKQLLQQLPKPII